MRLKDCIDDFKQIMPLVEEMANPALKQRHWEEIFGLIDANIPPSDDGTGFAPFSIRMLLQYNVLDKLEQIQVGGDRGRTAKQMTCHTRLERV